MIHFVDVRLAVGRLLKLMNQVLSSVLVKCLRRSPSLNQEIRAMNDINNLISHKLHVMELMLMKTRW